MDIGVARERVEDLSPALDIGERGFLLEHALGVRFAAGDRPAAGALAVEEALAAGGRALDHRDDACLCRRHLAVHVDAAVGNRVVAHSGQVW